MNKIARLILSLIVTVSLFFGFIMVLYFGVIILPNFSNSLPQNIEGYPVRLWGTASLVGITAFLYLYLTVYKELK